MVNGTIKNNKKPNLRNSFITYPDKRSSNKKSIPRKLHVFFKDDFQS